MIESLLLVFGHTVVVANGLSLSWNQSSAVYSECHVSYSLGAGKIRTDYYSSPICYLTEDGYVPYDMSFVLEGDVYRSAASDHPHVFSNGALAFFDGMSLELGYDRTSFDGNAITVGRKTVFCEPKAVCVESSVARADTSRVVSSHRFELSDASILRTGSTYTLFSSDGVSYLMDCPYIRDENGLFCAPTASYLAQNGNNWEISYSYEVDGMGNNLTEELEIREISRSISSSFVDKYFQVGSSDTQTGATLTIGKSAAMGEFGESVEHQGAIKISLSGSDTIESATLTLRRKNGTLNSLYAYQVISPSYESLNGNSSVNSSFLSISSVSMGAFTFDLTDAMDQAIGSNESSVVLLLRGFVSNAIANIYSSSSMHGPTLTVVTNNYGSANPFEFPDNMSNDNSVNCCGYALKGIMADIDINSHLQTYFGTSLVTLANMRSFIYSHFSAHFSSLRILDDYDSRIYHSERRVAFRIKYSSNSSHTYGGNYHFMRQCSDGAWAMKNGYEGSFMKLQGGDSSVTVDSNWLVYTSPTVYFAVVGYYV